MIHKDSVLHKYAGVELCQNFKNPNLYTMSKTDHEDILYSTVNNVLQDLPSAEHW